jgi:hypothetical protein
MLLRKTYNNIDKFRSFIYHRAAGYPARGAGPCCAAGSALWSREAGKRLLNAPGRRNLCRGEQCCEETSWFNRRRRPSAFLVGLCRRGGPRSRGGSSSLLTSASSLDQLVAVQLEGRLDLGRRLVARARDPAARFPTLRHSISVYFRPVDALVLSPPC